MLICKKYVSDNHWFMINAAFKCVILLQLPATENAFKELGHSLTLWTYLLCQVFTRHRPVWHHLGNFIAYFNIGNQWPPLRGRELLTKSNLSLRSDTQCLFFYWPGFEFSVLGNNASVIVQIITRGAKSQMYCCNSIITVPIASAASLPTAVTRTWIGLLYQTNSATGD